MEGGLIWGEKGRGQGRKAFSGANTQMLVAFLHLAPHPAMVAPIPDKADTSQPQLVKQHTMVLSTHAVEPVSLLAIDTTHFLESLGRTIRPPHVAHYAHYAHTLTVHSNQALFTPLPQGTVLLVLLPGGHHDPTADKPVLCQRPQLRNSQLRSFGLHHQRVPPRCTLTCAAQRQPARSRVRVSGSGR